jgi:glycosyltransferase involved in cell wall biosynthesis
VTPRPPIAFLVPDGIDDPERVTGGNEYDVRLTGALRAAGWRVDLVPIAGSWTEGTGRSRHVADAVAGTLDALPAGSVVLVDGLLAAPAAGPLTAHAARLRLLPVMHMTLAAPPPGHDAPGAAEAERSVLGAARAVVATSDWLGQQLVNRQRVDPQRVTVARPGVEPAAVAAASPAGTRLLCVGPVAPHKGQDVLVAALAQLADLTWSCSCVGALDRDVAFAASVQAAAARLGIADRVLFAGAHRRAEIGDDYAAADLLVLPSRSESYGMVVTEALARGLPVVVSAVGGVVEAATGAGSTADTSAPFPGAAVPPEDPDALAGALRQWLTDAGTRADWRHRAAQRRLRLAGWDVPARRVADAIASA